MSVLRQVAEDARRRRLIRTAVGECPSDDNEEVEEDSEQSDTKDHGRNDNIDLPKIEGECTTQK